MFDHYTTLKDIKFDDVGISKIDFCRADQAYVDDIYLTDLDGSLKPSTLSTVTSPSSLVSLRPTMMTFLDMTKCTNVPGKCYTYCQDTCFRGIVFEVDPTTSTNYMLKLCRASNPTMCIQVRGHRTGSDSKKPRYFAANLPIGQYTGVFLNSNGQEAWPSYVRQVVSDVTCPKVGTHTITMKPKP
jgi:hypothetical protein